MAGVVTSCGSSIPRMGVNIPRKATPRGSRDLSQGRGPAVHQKRQPLDGLRCVLFAPPNEPSGDASQTPPEKTAKRGQIEGQLKLFSPPPATSHYFAKSTEAERVTRHCFCQLRVKNHRPFRQKTCLSTARSTWYENQAVFADPNEEKDDLAEEVARRPCLGRVVDANRRTFLTATHPKVSARVTSEEAPSGFFRARYTVGG